MTSLKDKGRRWLEKRFVPTVEIVGYVLSALVAIAIGYTLFEQKDIVAPATGELAPTVETVSEGTTAVVVECFVADQQIVEPGTPLCRVVTTETDCRRVLAQRRLRETIDSLDKDSAASADTLTHLQKALDHLPSAQDVRTIESPVTGMVKLVASDDALEALPADAPIMRIYRADAVLFRGALTGANQALVAVGQPARLNLNLPEPVETVQLTGVVTEFDGVDAVTLRFEDIPMTVWTKLATDIFGGESTDTWGALNADVIVGQQSLFKHLFTGQK